MTSDLDDYLPCPGEPGFRQHPETGERFYSDAWLSDFAAGEAPLTEALAIAAGLASHPRVAEHPANPEGAQILALQARTRPADGDIGTAGVARRSKPRDPAGRPVVSPEVFGGSERHTLRLFIAQSMAATERHLERLLELEPDPMDQQILRGRLRQQQTLRAMFKDDTA
jgi:hypothetical protein